MTDMTLTEINLSNKYDKYLAVQNIFKIQNKKMMYIVNRT